MKKTIGAICATILLTAAFTGCKSAQQQASPLVPWLQEKVSHVNERYSSVTLYEMNGETYYALFCKGPKNSFDMNRTTIYDAEGNVYLTLGGPRQRSEKEIAFFNNATDKGVIWLSDVAKEEQQGAQ